MENIPQEIIDVSINGEEWRLVSEKGIDWYVSNFSRVYVVGQTCKFTRIRNGKEQVIQQIRKGGILSPCEDKNGYIEVARKPADSKRIKARVHRLVGIAWVHGYEDGLTINHINGIKTDNRPENLEWVSLAKNTKHEWDSGLVNLRGSNSPNSKLTSKQVVYMRNLYLQGIPGHTIDIIAGVSPGYTKQLVEGTKWKHLK